MSIELSQKSKYVREVLVDLVLSTRALALARRLGLRGARGGAALAIVLPNSASEHACEAPSPRGTHPQRWQKATAAFSTTRWHPPLPKEG